MAFTEDLFQAIKTIAGGLDELAPKDITILCEIKNNDEASKGKYLVQYQEAIFEAFSENTTYEVGAFVYVIVPLGDWNEKKMILGRKVSENSIPFNWVSPFNSFFEMGELYNTTQNFGLVANGATEAIYLAGSATEWIDFPSGSIYDRFGIKASFKTNLNDCVAGNYGVRLELKTKPYFNAEGNETTDIIAYDLTTSDMWGDPYNFITYFLQEKVFNVEANEMLSQWRLSFYQIPETFKTGDGALYPATVDNIISVPNNLFVNNIQLTFGYSFPQTSDDKVYLFATNGNTYGAEETKNALVNDSIQLNKLIKEYHRAVQPFDGSTQDDDIRRRDELTVSYSTLAQPIADNLQVVLDISDDTNNYEDILKKVPNLNIRATKTFQVCWWHILNSGTGVAIDKNEEFKSTEIDGELFVALYRYTGNTHSRTFAGLKYEQIENGRHSVNAETPLYFSYTPDNNLQEEKLKAVVYCLAPIEESAQKDATSVSYTEVVEDGKEVYRKIFAYASDDFIITNLQEISDENDSAITLMPMDKYGGKYDFYQNRDGRIIDDVEGKIDRICHLGFKSTNLGLNFLDKAESILWCFPINNTMIKFSNSNAGFAVAAENDGYMEYRFLNYVNEQKNYPNENIEHLVDDVQSNALNIIYTINDYNVSSLKNNTIYCQVIRDGHEYNANFTFTFGFKNEVEEGNHIYISLGDEYDENDNLLESDAPAWTIGASGYILLKPRMYNANGEDITNQTTNWNYTHYSGSNLFEINGNKLNLSHEITENDFGEIFKISGEVDGVIYDDYLIIPLRLNKDIKSFSGPIRIMYNTKGLEPKGYQSYFRYLDNNNEFQTITSGMIDYAGGSHRDCLPTLVKTEKYYLKPAPMFFDALTYSYGVNFEDKWRQPILIAMEPKKGGILDDWDGALQINESENRVLANTIGAGWKDSNNRFTGAIMGSVLENNQSEKTGENTGLFGYRAGEETFGFRADGTAFIGPASKGQITFNGEAGEIKSLNYQPYIPADEEHEAQEGVGSYWNLTTGFFETSYARLGKLIVGENQIGVDEEGNFISIQVEPVNIITGFTGTYQVAPQDVDITKPVFSFIESDSVEEPDIEQDIDNPWEYVGYMLFNNNGETKYRHCWQHNEVSQVSINTVNKIILTPTITTVNVLSKGQSTQGEPIEINVIEEEEP